MDNKENAGRCPRTYSRPLLVFVAATLGLLLVASTCPAGTAWDPDGVRVNDSGYGTYRRWVVSDGTGGAVVAWVEQRGTGEAIFAQRVDAGGNCLWGPNGRRVVAGSHFYGIGVAPGGGGEAIFAWSSQVEDEYRYVTYLQKLDGNGSSVWPEGGVLASNADGAKFSPAVVSDGAGGAVVSWTDTRLPTWDYNIYAQRVDTGGGVLWDPAGVPVCTEAGSQSETFMAPGGDGGAVVGWRDGRTGEGMDLYAQKLSPEGAGLWAPGGTTICGADGEKEYPSIVTDGSGGAIAAWEDSRGDFFRVYSQRIDSAGTARWREDGNRVCVASGNQINPRLAEDGAGGALLVWGDMRDGGFSAYAQHLDPRGNRVPGWPAAGNRVSTYDGLTGGADIVSNGSGGALISFTAGEGRVFGAARAGKNGVPVTTLVQNLLSDGTVAPGWSEEGEPVTVTPTNQQDSAIVSDGAGGAIVVWRDFRSNWQGELYAQKLNTTAANWYLAEGSTAWGFDTYISVANPNQRNVTARTTFMTPDGQIAPLDINLPAASQTTISPKSFLASDADFSTKVECLQDLPIAVDRTMFWTGPGAPSAEAHSSIGVNSPARTWYMPEGSSAWGFECWLLVQNPNAGEATCSVTYMIEGGNPRTVKKVVPANSRRSYNIADDIGANDASIQVVSDIPVVPERSMYRNDRRAGHESVGTTRASTDYYLAEGTTAWGFTTYVLVQNPNDELAMVTLNFNTPGGRVSMDPFTMPPYSRKTVRLNDLLPDTDVSTQVHSDLPIIAERAMYWGKRTKLGEATHDSIGMPDPHGVFYLPDGQTSGGRETFTLVQNPNKTPVQVRITYLAEDGTDNITFLETVPAFGRRTFNMADKLPDGRAAVTVECITSGGKIMVERAMYWNGRGAGTCTIGGFSN